MSRYALRIAKFPPECGCREFFATPVTESGLEALEALCAGAVPGAINAWPVGSLYIGPSDPNVWCGGTWDERPGKFQGVSVWERTA